MNLFLKELNFFFLFIFLDRFDSEKKIICLINVVFDININLFIYFFFLIITFKYNFSKLNIIFYIFFFYLYFFFCNKDITTQIDYVTLNKQLINGIFIIHPLIFYFLASYLLIKFSTNYFFFFFKFLKYKNNSISLLIFSCIGLLLGSLWALQELNWNNWWSWDIIEIFNLFFLIFFIYLFHSSYFIKNKKKILFLLFCLFLLNRYNILPSMHSFLSNSSLNQFINYILLVFFF